MNNAKLSLQIEATLAEGPLFHQPSNQLFWTDILSKTLNRYDLHSKVNIAIETPWHIGAFSFTNKENVLMLATHCGFILYNYITEDYEIITNPLHDASHMRFNDGKTDPNGRFWAGTMEFSPSGPNGHLYTLDMKNEVTQQLGELTISNGIAWSLDYKTMYLVDSGIQSLFKFTFDPIVGTISDKTLLYQFDEANGTPDGITIDENDQLFIAMWGGHKVIHFNPKTTEIIAEIQVPAPHVTSVTFGGSELKTLYITTARDGLTQEQLEQFPLSGSIFEYATNLRGTLPFPYEISIKEKFK
ncbi:SMP-30/gluconolactonase/LRE family protein [Lysinibacillus piscis]|uniref:Regucalcin-like protein n=1 Tax=Lysinibacillus piscis TaxID=2518931 RepID=A0ABQ5NPR9_9BACI|nr:SMP-30/gluconolactonase/LRE family protein [Lysinibacillus sp. KH24]GLC90357.1 regucalcin-like protein [Lysinibacillus sp. KH24]